MTMKIRQIVGINFCVYRKHVGLSQFDLADMTHTSQRTISRIENGCENFRIATLEILVSRLGVPVYYVFLPTNGIHYMEIINHEGLCEATVQLMYRFYLTARHIFDPETNTHVFTYGIKMESDKDENITIEDISTDKEFVLYLVNMCNCFQIPREHFPDIIRDAMLKAELDRIEECFEA